MKAYFRKASDNKKYWTDDATLWPDINEMPATYEEFTNRIKIKLNAMFPSVYYSGTGGLLFNFRDKSDKAAFLLLLYNDGVEI